MEYLHFQICVFVFKLMFWLIMESEVIYTPLHDMVLWHLEIKWFCTPKSLESRSGYMFEFDEEDVILGAIPWNLSRTKLGDKCKSFGCPVNYFFMMVCRISMCHIQRWLCSKSIPAITNCPVFTMVCVVPSVSARSGMVIDR